MHVHDEIIVDKAETDIDALEKITAIMAQPKSWAQELPFGDGCYETPFYKKD